MYTQTILKAFIGFLLIHTLTANLTSNLDIIDACYGNPENFADNGKLILESLAKIKAGLIQDSAVKQQILSNPADLDRAKQKLLKCTEELMRRNQFKIIEDFIEDILEPLDLDLSGEMRQIGNQIKKDIDNIIALAHTKKNIQTVSPAFQWIQSKNNILLQIKFAHRHDAPGCLEVRDQKVEFTQNGMRFSAIGTQGLHPIQFVLNLDFYKDVLPEESNWNLESVGRMFVNVTKANPEVWVSLLKNNERLPQMRVWWEMKDAYEEDMKEYDKLVEQLEEEDEAPRKSRSRKRKSVESAPAAESAPSASVEESVPATESAPVEESAPAVESAPIPESASVNDEKQKETPASVEL